MFSRFCSFVLKMLGWEVVVEWPESRKYIIVVYPHTSNWDFLLGIFASRSSRLKSPHFIAKHTLFKKPFGWFFRGLGGIPVDRRHRASVAQQLAERFDEAEEFILGLAPEGTRSHSDHWKSGFYHIARAAKVPIVMAFFDYPNKQVGLGGEFYPGESIGETYEQIRGFFEGKQGKNPEQASTIAPRSL